MRYQVLVKCFTALLKIQKKKGGLSERERGVSEDLLLASCLSSFQPHRNPLRRTSALRLVLEVSSI